jgi:hypothetical protein
MQNYKLESRDQNKNGANPKSLMSRNKKTNILCIVEIVEMKFLTKPLCASPAEPLLKPEINFAITVRQKQQPMQQYV